MDGFKKWSLLLLLLGKKNKTKKNQGLKERNVRNLFLPDAVVTSGG